MFGLGRHAALLAGLLTGLAGCGPAVEIGGDASAGDPSPTGASTSTTSTGVSPTTSVPPATVDPSGVDVTSGTGSSGPSATGPSTTEDTIGDHTFLVPPDGGHVSIECSLFEQDCPRGEKCNIWANDGGNAWNATRCFPIDRAPDGPAEPCAVEDSGVSGLDSCDVGSVCWGVDKTGEGTCVSFCSGSEEAPICEGSGLRCTGSNLFFLCLPNCDPLVQDCAEGEACYLHEDTPECEPDDSQDAGAAFETCASPNACDPGLNCMNAAFVGLCNEGEQECCTPFCDLQDPTCPEGTLCISAFPEGLALPGHEDVGLCGQDPG